MTVVFIFVLATLPLRRSRRSWVQRYGPLFLVGLAGPLVVADNVRHNLQDEQIRVLDPLALILAWAAVPAFIFARMAYTGRKWGPFHVPTHRALTSPYFQHVPMLLVLASLSLFVAGRSMGDWFGSQRLRWLSCGNNQFFNRVNHTWTDDCFWSSTMYRCELYCCVPGGDGHLGLVPPSALPDGECDCSCIEDTHESLRNLSPMGILFTLIFTYSGFVLLGIGTLWNANLLDKWQDMQVQWRLLRASPTTAEKVPLLSTSPTTPDYSACEEVFTDSGNPGEPRFAVVVIGGGSGGLACARACAELGQTVAVLDFVTPSPAGSTWGLGGTCVNVGCIPKKLMHEAALRGARLPGDAAFGWVQVASSSPSHDWRILRANVQQHIRSLNRWYVEDLAKQGITYYNARGAFVSPHRLELQHGSGVPTHITGQRFVLAMGGRPLVPSIPGAEFGVTSDDLFSLEDDPGTVVVVGASYVALECAGFLAGTGHAVTVLMRSIPLRGFDQQMAEKVVDDMEARGVRFLRPAVPVRINRRPDGQKEVVYGPPSGGSEETLLCDTVLFAVGRQPGTGGLALEVPRVRTTDSGHVVADRWGCTSASHIYAIGDIVQEGLELTPVAIRAGQCVARRLFGNGAAFVDYQLVPTTVFTPLEYGCVGLSEDAAVAQYGEDHVEVYHAETRPLEWALPPVEQNPSPCYLKLVCHTKADMKVVGFHLLGPHAAEITQGVAVALQAGSRKRHFDAAIGIHPSLAELMTQLTVTKRSAGSAAKDGC